jgi:hypothetical protein
MPERQSYVPAVAERRRRSRLTVAIPMFVRGTDQHGKPFVDFTTVLNISSWGVLLVLNRRLKTQAQVSLEIPVGLLPPSTVDEGGAKNSSADGASRARREGFCGRRPVFQSVAVLTVRCCIFALPNPGTSPRCGTQTDALGKIDVCNLQVLLAKPRLSSTMRSQQ